MLRRLPVLFKPILTEAVNLLALINDRRLARKSAYEFEMLLLLFDDNYLIILNCFYDS